MRTPGFSLWSPHFFWRGRSALHSSAGHGVRGAWGQSPHPLTKVTIMARPQLSVTGPPQPESVDDQWEVAARIQPEKTTWLVPDRIMAESVTMIEGHKGSGKSTFLAHLVAAVTRGRAVLGRKKIPKGNVIWSGAEEAPGKFAVPRLKAAGADMDRVHFPSKDGRGVRRRLTLPGSVGNMRAAIEHFGATLIVLDPLSSHVPATLDLRNDQAIHEALDPLADLAHSARVTCIVTRNLVKSKGVDRLHAGLGGAAVGGVARSVLLVDWPDRLDSRRLLRLVACNSTKNNRPLEYRLVDAGGCAKVDGLRELASSEDDDSLDQDEPDEKDARENACELLRALLATEDVDVRTIQAEAENAGVSLRTLRRAKVQLGIRHRRVPGSNPARWEWRAPLQGWS